MATNIPQLKRKEDVERDYEIRAAIRYLDPDQEEKAPPVDADVPVVTGLLVFFLVAFMAWLVLYLRTW
jgi:hypothetical protein